MRIRCTDKSFMSLSTILNIKVTLVVRSLARRNVMLNASSMLIIAGVYALGILRSCCTWIGNEVDSAASLTPAVYHLQTMF